MATDVLPISPPGCPSCGFSTPLEASQVELVAAQKRIADLEHQVRVLNEKAAAAVEKWAGYEDELCKLRAKVNRANSNGTSIVASLSEEPTPLPSASPAISPFSARPSTPVRHGSLTSTPLTASPTKSTILQSSTNRISAFLSRKPSTNSPRVPSSSLNRELPPTPDPFPHNPSEQPPGAETQDLIKQLTREKSLRKEAEGRLTATSKEVEELSAALFEQANEMVADERRARAKLEERVGELEKRDAEKRRRLERLEGAMGRIERVRNLLAEDNKTRDRQ